MTGDSRADPLLVAERETFGINSPNMIVRNVSGSTIKAIWPDGRHRRREADAIVQERLDAFGGARASDRRGDSANKVMATCTAARLASMFSFMYIGGLGPARFSRAKTCKRAAVTAAKAIS